jgi:hypothetical protein
VAGNAFFVGLELTSFRLNWILAQASVSRWHQRTYPHLKPSKC